MQNIFPHKLNWESSDGHKNFPIFHSIMPDHTWEGEQERECVSYNVCKRERERWREREREYGEKKREGGRQSFLRHLKLFHFEVFKNKSHLQFFFLLGLKMMGVGKSLFFPAPSFTDPSVRSNSIEWRANTLSLLFILDIAS